MKRCEGCEKEVEVRKFGKVWFGAGERVEFEEKELWLCDGCVVQVEQEALRLEELRFV